MIMTVQGGALWGNVYRTLVDDEEGLMINGGRCPTVGVSGFILGGGIGPFSRTLGMAVDGLVEVTIVTAEGDLITVSAEDAPDTDEGKHVQRNSLPSLTKDVAVLKATQRLGAPHF